MIEPILVGLIDRHMLGLQGVYLNISRSATYLGGELAWRCGTLARRKCFGKRFSSGVSEMGRVKWLGTWSSSLVSF